MIRCGLVTTLIAPIAMSLGYFRLSNFLIFCLLVAPLAAARAGSDDDAKISRDCSKACVLFFRGGIERGDAALIQRAILQSPAAVTTLQMDSEGGDVFEALNIGDVLIKYFVRIATLNCVYEHGGRFCTRANPAQMSNVPTSQQFNERSMCASACALAALIANERVGSEFYLHRPYFPAIWYAKLSAQEAQDKYEKAKAEIVKRLSRAGVDQQTIQMVLDTPSNSAVRLREGYPKRSPWLDEWFAAKCKRSPDANEITDSDELDAYFDHAICEINVGQAERKRRQRK